MSSSISLRNMKELEQYYNATELALRNVSFDGPLIVVSNDDVLDVWRSYQSFAGLSWSREQKINMECKPSCLTVAHITDLNEYFFVCINNSISCYMRQGVNFEMVSVFDFLEEKVAKLVFDKEKICLNVYMQNGAICRFLQTENCGWELKKTFYQNIEEVIGSFEKTLNDVYSNNLLVILVNSQLHIWNQSVCGEWEDSKQRIDIPDMIDSIAAISPPMNVRSNLMKTRFAYATGDKIYVYEQKQKDEPFEVKLEIPIVKENGSVRLSFGDNGRHLKIEQIAVRSSIISL